MAGTLRTTLLLALATTALLVGPAVLAQTPNPVTNGGFEALDDDGLPVDWQILGTGEITDDAHSGDAAVRLIRTADDPSAETGLNRDWVARSGRQGTMLPQTRGGLLFWYKLESADDDAVIDVYAIGMSALPLEDTGARRAEFSIANSLAGDGQWRQGRLAYDFTDKPEVKWVHISPRIVGGAATLLLDDFEWVDRVGPVPSITKVEFTEDALRPGDRGYVEATIRNVGDGPTKDAAVSIAAPDGLNVLDTPARAPLESLAPGATTRLRWRLDGRRLNPGVVRLTATSGEAESSSSLALGANMRIDQLETSAFVIAKGQTTDVVCWVENTGHTMLTGLQATLEAGKPFQVTGRATQSAPMLAPGRMAALTFNVRANDESPGQVASVEVACDSVKDTALSAETFIMATAPARGPLPAALGAVADNDMAVVSNEAVRLLFRKSSYGFGAAEVFVRGTGAYHPVGRLPRLGRLVLPGDEEPEDHLLFADAVTAEGDALTFTKQLDDASGRTWSFTWTIRAEAGKPYADFSVAAKCSDDAEILALEGPMLYVGEGSFGGLKTEAVFPGLEWLVGTERSSNDLEIDADHPHRIRYVPHANMITIPMMSVAYNDLVVGLLWDAKQRWDGVHDRPSAAFASPDWIEGKRAHLMGLFLPSTTEWVEPNERLASTPCPVEANQQLALSAQILGLAPATDPLVAMDQWIALYGLPEPAPIPRGAYRDEVAFSMAAYLDSLWIKEEGKWWTSRGGGILSDKGLPLGFVYDLRMGAKLSPDPEVAAACTELADRVKAPGLAPVGNELGLRFGEAARDITVSVSQIANLIDSRGPDGLWRFDADHVGAGVFDGVDYHILGPDDALEVGTVAHNAYQLIRYALISGDDQIFLAALPALEAMKRFTVPRAAQVWEVPVHAPDILAASDAVDAYVAAYEFTGDAAWLEQARIWARKGLPFVYLWDDDDQPFLRYASIPVFGATLRLGSWFGRPVQWNGLRYARAVSKLAAYDRTFDWKTVSEGLTRSGMYQQSTDEDDIALWPDSIGAIEGDKSAWVFAPALILWNVYDYLGYEPDGRTTVVRTSTGPIHITALSAVSGVRFENGVLAFRMRYANGDHGLVLVSAITEPQYVLVDGKELARATSPIELRGAAESAWAYLPELRRAAIWIADGGRHEVEIEGIQPRAIWRLPQLVQGVDFGFQASEQGWSAANDMQEVVVEGGALKLVATGPDPFMTRSRVLHNGSLTPKVVFRLQTEAEGHGQFYWTTQSSPGYAEDKVALFDLKPGPEPVEYKLDLSDHPLWVGHTITGVRLDFCNGQPGAAARLEYLRAVK